MADSLRIRRTEPRRWSRRKRNDVELLAPDGSVRAAVHGTVGPSGFLIKVAGVHSTDSWDWVSAADRAFDRGSREWVTWPYGDWRPSTQREAPLRDDL